MSRKLRYAILCFYLYYFIPIRYVDPELVAYKTNAINLVKQYCKKGEYNNPLHQYIYFKKLKPPEVGECIIKFHTYKILVDTDSWKEYNENERAQLMYHEFAHCLLFKEHVDNVNNYMYYSMVPLMKKTVEKQFIEDIRSKCGR